MHLLALGASIGGVFKNLRDPTCRLRYLGGYFYDQKRIATLKSNHFKDATSYSADTAKGLESDAADAKAYLLKMNNYVVEVASEDEFTFVWANHQQLELLQSKSYVVGMDSTQVVCKWKELKVFSIMVFNNVSYYNEFNHTIFGVISVPF